MKMMRVTGSVSIMSWPIAAPVSAGTKVLPIDFSLDAGSGDIGEWREPGFDLDDDVRFVPGTSGTTGRKKQLGFSQHLLLQRIDDLETNLGAFAPRTLVHVPPTVPFGLMIILLKFRAGGTVVLPGIDHEATLKRLIEGACDDIIAAPAIHSILVSGLAQRNLRLSSIKRAMSGGGPVSPALIDAIRERISPELLQLLRLFGDRQYCGRTKRC